MRAMRTLVVSGLVLASSALAACGSSQIGVPIKSLRSQALVDPDSGAQCNGKDLKLTRDYASLVIQGQCGAVVVTASHVELNLVHADSLRVEGNEVTVLNQQARQVSVTGRQNTLKLRQAELVELSGDFNAVLVAQAGTVRFSGRNNSVTPTNKPAVEDRGDGNRVL